MGPVLVMLNVVCVVLSPQFTSTDHGLSAPGSLKLPRLNDAGAPSLAAWFAGAVTVGATFATATVKLAEPEPPFLSVTVTAPLSSHLSPYVCACVPSGPVLVMLNVVCVVPSPQFTSTDHGLSAPGSLKLPRLNDARAPSLATWFAGAVTVGVTLFTSSEKRAVGEQPFLSVTVTVTV